MRHSKWAAVGAVLVLLGLVLRTAWVAEDAYITLRTVDNWVHGFGLRWNTDERVQGYTHPLWMLLLSAGYFVTREEFLTTIALSMATTACALFVLVKGAESLGHALTCVSLLIFSRAFIEFSTSGLENPLTHLLTALFAVRYLRGDRNLRALAFNAACLAATRIDALIVLVPALAELALVVRHRQGTRRVLLDLALGFSPLIAWELFSLFYYGFWVPNTAYAKLNTGIASAALARQGRTYLVSCFAWDPATLLSIGLGLLSAAASKQRKPILLALGVLLYLFYVVRIGGDFMLGRFLTLPLFLALVVLSRTRIPLEVPTHAAAVVLPFALLFLHPNAQEPYAIGDLELSGVADERSYYDDTASLMMMSRNVRLPNHPWIEQGWRARRAAERVLVQGNVGYFGFAAGPTVHIIDPVGLTEPLLARLPVEARSDWRIGHWERNVPVGFVESVRTGRCAMEDKDLCTYDAHLREVVAGELWSWRRLKTVIGFQLGAYDALIDRDRYRHPTRPRAALHSLCTLQEGGESPAAVPRELRDDGLEIEIEALSHAGRVSLGLQGDDSYELSFHRGKKEVGRLEVRANGGADMHRHELDVPRRAQRTGFDRVRVTPVAGDGRYAIGQLCLHD